MLVAISIPIFTSQLEKSREATDMANLRSAYAECSAAVLTGVAEGDDSGVTVNTDGDASKDVVLTQREADWQTVGHENMKIATVPLDNIPTSGTVTVKVTHDGKCTIGAKSGS